MAASPLGLAQRLPFYYGWLIVGAQFMAVMATAGPTTWAFGVFAGPMEAELGWGRGTLFGAVTVRMIIGVGLMPFMSRLMDKPRWPALVMVSTSVAYAVSLMLVATVQTVTQYYLVLGVLGGLSAAGASGGLYQAIVPKWFIRKRGRAVAFGSMGSSLAALTSPLYVGLFVDSFGWRSAWLLTGVVMFVVMVPIATLVRRQPEDVGLLPDGAVVEAPSAAARAAPSGDVSFTVGQALRSPTTWFLIAATVLISGSLQGLGSSWINHYQDSGLSKESARLSVSADGIFAIGGRIAWGLASERVHIRHVFLFACVVTGLPLILLTNVTSLPMAMLYSALAGLTLGGYVSIQALIWADYYGRRNLGAIRAYFATPSLYAAAAGPWWIAMLHDSTGGYQSAYWVMLGGWLAAAGLVYVARPLRNTEPSSAPKISAGP